MPDQTPKTRAPAAQPTMMGLAAVGLAAFICIAFPSILSADVAYRFTGNIVDSRDGTRVVDEQYDRSDPGGQGDVRFDEFPPAAPVSRHIRATSSAGPYYLSASSFAQFIKDTAGGPSFSESLTGTSLARGTFDDVIISGPAGLVSTAVNAHVGGTQTAGAFAGSLASSDVQAVFNVDGTNRGFAERTVTSNGGDVSITESGGLIGFNGNAVILSSPFSVQANVPFTLQMSLITSALVQINNSNSSNPAANTDFGSTMTFATDRPVFNLPAGYTANSAQAGIVNNQFVPEPSAAALLTVAGMVGAAARRRGRRAVRRHHDGRIKGGGKGVGSLFRL